MILLLMLGQAAHKMLECVFAYPECAAFDLELNRSYAWITITLTRLLNHHPDLKGFPTTFEPAVPDLFPLTILESHSSGRALLEAERFLIVVQDFVGAHDVYEPLAGSPAWTFIEGLRPLVEAAIGRALIYRDRICRYAAGDSTPTERNAMNRAPLNGKLSTGDSATLPKSGPSIELGRPGQGCRVLGVAKKALTDGQYAVISALIRAGEAGMSKDTLEVVRPSARRILKTLTRDPAWAQVILMPGQTNGRYRVRP